MASATASATSPEQSVTPCDCSAIQRYEDHVAAIQLSKQDKHNTDGKPGTFFLTFTARD